MYHRRGTPPRRIEFRHRFVQTNFRDTSVNTVKGTPHTGPDYLSSWALHAQDSWITEQRQSGLAFAHKFFVTFVSRLRPQLSISSIIHTNSTFDFLTSPHELGHGTDVDEQIKSILANLNALIVRRGGSLSFVYVRWSELRGAYSRVQTGGIAPATENSAK